MKLKLDIEQAKEKTRDRPVQYFSDEYIERYKDLSTEEILQFIDDFQKLHSQNHSIKKEKSKLISLKVEPYLLNTFKHQCERQCLKYQTQIKQLMREWLLKQ